MITKGSYVLIERILMQREERSASLPKETQLVDVKGYSKGRLMHDAELFDEVSIETVIFTLEKGVLIEVNPSYLHSYGEYVEEMSHIGESLKKIVEEGDPS